MFNNSNKKSKQSYLTFILIFVITFLSRNIFSEKYFFDADTVGVALGSISYSLQNTRPHLPGYFLHVKLISLLNLIFKDTHQTMIILSELYSSFGAIFCFVLMKKWLPVKKALLITALIIFNPLVWFQGSTPEIYSFDLFLSSLFVILSLNPRWIYITPATVAVALGVRQSTGLLLLPLYIYFWYKKYKSEDFSINKFYLSHTLALVIFLFWFIPMVNTTGGISEYLKLYKINSPLPNISLLQNIFLFSSYCFFVFTPLIFIQIFLRRKKKLLDELTATSKNEIFIFLLWLVPSVVTFIFFTYTKGYFLISIVPLYALIVFLNGKYRVSYFSLTFIIILEILFFTLVPYKFLPVQSIIKPELRKTNLLQTWTDRTFSSYLMTYSRIKYQDEQIEELSEIVEHNKPDIVFLDPTIYLAARGMQLKYPRVTFITMDFYKTNSYLKYNGLNISSEFEFDKVLINVLLITRVDFYDYYLKNMKSNLSSKGNYRYMYIDSECKDVLFNQYQKLFKR